MHTRLAVVDCSKAGHQPMRSPDGRFVVAYNGEIYNHDALRGELAAAGHLFRSRSDTEVLLAAYAEWGSECLARFQGMFAFALIDNAPPRGAPTLFLARDRFGIKPLVYHDDGEFIRFASELRALFALGVERRVAPDALGDYAAFGAVGQPRTMIRDVLALPPGHFLLVSDGRRLLRRYWDLHEATGELRALHANISPSHAIELIRAELGSAAIAHLVADVPVGAFLSGGLDSTAVVGWMAKKLGRPVSTFAVGFAQEHRAIDERRHARVAADHLGCDHHEVVVDGATVARDFHDLVNSLDQPSNDGANTWFVSRAARPHVTVALSGLGGDELFGGYSHFEEMSVAPPISGMARVATSIVRRLNAIRPTAIGYRFLCHSLPEAERYGYLRRLLLDEQLDRQLAVDARRTAARITAELAELIPVDADQIQRISYVETRTYLLNTLLRDADAMSMRHSLEVRPMLLHHPLAELVYSLPARLKTGEWSKKRLLVDASTEFIPKSLRIRSKAGFAMPWIIWMRGPLRPVLLDALSGEWARRILHPRYRQRLLAGAERRRPVFAHWAWAVLLTWLESSGVSG